MPGSRGVSRRGSLGGAGIGQLEFRLCAVYRPAVDPAVVDIDATGLSHPYGLVSCQRQKQ